MISRHFSRSFKLGTNAIRSALPKSTKFFSASQHQKGLNDWNKDENNFNYTRGRFVYDEINQLRQRRVHFDLHQLGDIAAHAVGAARCIKIEKCPDGMYNKAYILTMDSGMEVIGKVPNPNAGMPHYTTASEVATMDFMRNVLSTRTPRVYAWNSKVDQNNPVGAEYIVMEKLPGIPLVKVWNTLKVPDRLKICLQIFELHKKWTGLKFSQFGSLYYSEDVEFVTPGNQLYIDETGLTVANSRFIVGPALGREWIDNGRRELQCDRGPWRSILDLRSAIVRRETAAVNMMRDMPKQLAMFYGPGVYQPSAEKKLAALLSLSRILEDLLPKEPDLSTGHLWHNDLHMENIFVKADNPKEVLGIIDWQSVQIMPLSDHSMDPVFIDYQGPDVGDDLKPPEIAEGTDALPLPERKIVIKHFYTECLMVAWRMLVKAKNPTQYKAIRFRETTAGHLLQLVQNLAVCGEAQVQALMLDLRGEWAELSPKPNFPIEYSDEEIAEIEADFEAADMGVRVMGSIRERLGDLWPEKGIMELEYYDTVMAELREIKAELMEILAKTEEDKGIFLKYWPFDC